MSDSPPNSEPSFEQAMERLEEIVALMEGDRMPLDEMVTSYEEGMRLLQICRQRIDSARQRVEAIALNAEGKATLAPFEPVSGEPADDKPKAAPRRRPVRPEAEPESDDIRLF